LVAVPVTSLMKCEADTAHVSTALSAAGAAARGVEPQGVAEAGASAPGRQWQRRCRRQQRAGPLAPTFLPQHAPEVSEQQTTVAKQLQHIFQQVFQQVSQQRWPRGCITRVLSKQHRGRASDTACLRWRVSRPLQQPRFALPVIQRSLLATWPGLVGVQRRAP